VLAVVKHRFWIDYSRWLEPGTIVLLLESTLTIDCVNEQNVNRLYRLYRILLPNGNIVESFLRAELYLTFLS
jgi:hypothetical protein